MSRQKAGPVAAGKNASGEDFEEAARDLVRAVDEEPVSDRLRELARELARALDRRLSEIEGKKE
jgi:hypothetical protein